MSSMQQALHYNGPATGCVDFILSSPPPTDLRSPSSLANALNNADSTGPISICCQWQGADDVLRCCMLIKDENLNVPDHFNKVHKIKGGRKVKIQCRWGDCENTVVRHNFVRHIREAHLGRERR
ncbi:hypothetical protein SCLCIDRAFT_29963 [Scleroderma citrinum Foug A]|uniref:Uncharacterized protein n=1 Tax=Scleroderma citrinum Foug A TaxID=1036808 RepID=A0A0C3D523_9AGAM|nr:hypothetical protein SCLCIDRAFT_29963 [Scleroderma citrinum Foug A]